MPLFLCMLRYKTKSKFSHLVMYDATSTAAYWGPASAAAASQKQLLPIVSDCRSTHAHEGTGDGKNASACETSFQVFSFNFLSLLFSVRLP